ncbi:MAG: serine--tRNA ligase [Spirochaetaceae bacterium]|jgi:seryl-tRNA synthetase|nr:serine--tRNA ligase [Spirochaetaceae bacterium]
MLDYRFIVENIDAVKENIKNRAVEADADEVVRLYNKRTSLITEIQGLQRERNANAQAMKGKVDDTLRQALIEEGREIKERVAASEEELKTTELELEREAKKVPNMAHHNAPIGPDDTFNSERLLAGRPTRFSFTPKDHVTLGHELDIIDFDTATKVSGTKFYYLKNEGVMLELGLVRYALDILVKKGWTPYITPDIAKDAILDGTGFNPRGPETNVYCLEGEDSCLIGTAEITLGGYHADEIIPKEKLPIKMVGLSHCFRREAGAAGRFSKGLYRVHQFTKLEMFVFCLPRQSDILHDELRLIEEEIFSTLDIPFRVMDICTGDLGAPAYRKWDIEAWMPGRGEGEYGEVTSTSNCTDYQARRLNIRYKDETGKNHFVHTLNGTALAVSRAIIAILENFQREDGSVHLPKALVPYCGFEIIRAKKKG